jgi:hypothetical protein
MYHHRPHVRMFALLWLALLSMVAITAHAKEGAQVWQGTLGKASIVLRLDDSGESNDDQYYYIKYRLGIDLHTSRGADGVLTVEELSSRSSDEPAVWTLMPPSADGHLRGEWRKGDKRLPIALRLVDSDALKKSHDLWFDQMRMDDPYNYLRFVDTSLEQVKEETVRGYKLRWLRESESGIELFRVMSGYSDAQLPGVNQSLSRRHWQEVAAFLDCSSAEHSEYSTATTLRYIGRDALSVSLYADYYCGGAYPFARDNPLNLDPRTGREFALEDLLWLGEGVPPKYGSEDWFPYRSEVFAPWVLERMSELYPKEVAGEIESADGRGHPDCTYDMAEFWSDASWHLRPEGIYLGAAFPTPARICNDPSWSVLPWSEVKQHPGPIAISISNVHE